MSPGNEPQGDSLWVKWHKTPDTFSIWTEQYHLEPGFVQCFPENEVRQLKKQYPDNIEILGEKQTNEKIKTIETVPPSTIETLDKQVEDTKTGEEGNEKPTNDTATVKWHATEKQPNHLTEKFQLKDGDVKAISIDDAMWLKKNFPDNVEVYGLEPHQPKIREELEEWLPEE